jgi:hypothetical protein
MPQHQRHQHPHPQQSGPGSARSIGALFSHGRLTAIPRRAVRRDQLLTHLAETLFAPGRAYTEPEVNDALLTVHEDYAALRRYLISARHLTRTPDGRTYHRAP